MAEDDLEIASVLAFLDAFNADASLPIPPSRHVEASDLATGQPERPLHWKERGYSTMVVRRKRAELQVLRNQARELEMQLDEMKRHHMQASRRCVLAKNAWLLQTARKEDDQQATQEAKMMNKRLRSRLVGLKRLREDIVKAISKFQRRESAYMDVCYVPEAIKSPAVLSRTLVLGDASRMLDAMVGEVDAVFASIALHPLNATASSSLTSAAKEEYGEVRSTIAARCNVDIASGLLWGKPPGDHPPPLVNDRANDDSSYRLEAFLRLRMRGLPEVKLYLQHFGRRVVNPVTGRVVLVVLALLRIPAVSDEVLLWEQFWTSIEPTNELGITGSIAHSCYHIRAGTPATTSKATELQKRVRHSLMLLTRQNAVIMQNWLLNAAAPVASTG